MEQIVIISLIITAIHVSMWDGMILALVRRLVCTALDRMRLTVLRKPLCECLICMGGVYTLAIYPILYGLSWHVLPTMLGVIGLNTLISAIIRPLQDF